MTQYAGVLVYYVQLFVGHYTSEASPQTDERAKAISLEIEFITEPCVANQMGI